MKHLFLATCFLVGSTLLSQAQQAAYTNFKFSLPLPPALPALQRLQQFDAKALLTSKISDSFLSQEVIKEFRESVAAPLKVSFGTFQQVDSTGELHVIALVQQFKYEPSDATNLNASIALHTTVYDQAGNALFAEASKLSSVTVPNEKQWTGGQLEKNRLAVVSMLLGKAVSENLKPFAGRVFGYTADVESKIGFYDDVKKMPELRVVEDQINQLKSATKKGGVPAYLAAVEPMLPGWIKLSTYAGPGEVNEVKRIAYHNLAQASLLKGDYARAAEYLATYKPIDKTVRGMMGLDVYKNSERLEALLAQLNPNPNAGAIATTTRPLTLREAVDAHQFYTVKGKILVEGKRNAGDHTGEIRIVKPEPYYAPVGGGSMYSLPKAEDLTVLVSARQPDGSVKQFTTYGSSVKEIQGEDGSNYVVRKFGSALTGSTYCLLKTAFTSPKLTVYKAVIPASDGDYVALKPGDEKGVKSSLLNARKDLLAYLSDCASLSKKFEGTGTDFDVVKVAEAYTSCR